MIKWELRSESRRDMNKSYHSGVGLPKYRNIFFSNFMTLVSDALL